MEQKKDKQNLNLCFAFYILLSLNLAYIIFNITFLTLFFIIIFMRHTFGVLFDQRKRILEQN